ncbi:MAG: mevalonate kinase [Kofleriaceae bacterium]
MTCIGWGKIILLGEHSVVYGYPALAAALDRGVTIAAVPTPAGGSLRIDVPAWNLRNKVDDDCLPARSLAVIADALGVGRPSVSLVGDAQIPAGEGLGSSAALAVAVARALLVHAKLPLDLRVIREAAAASEHLFHHRPSGVDVALATTGGIGVFRRASGLRSFESAPLRVLVGATGAQRSTAEMVERVSASVKAIDDDSRLRELGALTDVGTTALVARDLPALGAAMNRAHEVLAGLGVSTDQLDSLCQAARVSGAYGAKLTGAGGGGAVIAIAPREREQAVLTEWKNVGVTGFVATVGGGA